MLPSRYLRGLLAHTSHILHILDYSSINYFDSSHLSRDGLPVGDQVWLFLRKNVDGKIKYAISNAPKQISFSDLIKASTMRWPIEQCFQEGKDQVGMDYYEHRSWPDDLCFFGLTFFASSAFKV